MIRAFGFALSLMLLFASCQSSGDDEFTAIPSPEATIGSGAAPTKSIVPTVTPQPFPIDSSWRLIELDGAPVLTAFGVTLAIESGLISGESGCNAFGASFTTSDPDAIVIDEISTDDEVCPEPLNALNLQERYYDALHNSVRYVVSADQLTFLSGDGATLLVFEPLVDAVSQPTASPASTPAEPTPTTPIAESGNWEIYVINADGSNEHRPSPSLAGESWPAWTPDGRLSFQSNRTGEQRLYTVNPDGTDLEESSIDLTSITSRVEWSADGSQIYYASKVDGLEQLYVADADGLNPRRITEIANGTVAPDWSPDGSRAVFVNWSHGPSTIYVVNSDGAGLQRLTFEQEASDDAPVWSPDGRQIAFARYPNQGQGGIFIMNADGSGLRQLTENDAGDSAPSWSPDGSQIAFGRHQDIWVVNVDGSNLHRLTKSPFVDEMPVWSPDGSQIAFTSNRDGGQPVACSYSAIADYIGIESLEHLVWLSNTIVKGTIVERFPSAFGDPQVRGLDQPELPISTDYLVEVDIWIRGDTSEMVRVREQGGTVGDCVQTWLDEPVLEVGSQVLLFMQNDTFNVDLPHASRIIAGNQGFWPVEDDGRVGNERFERDSGVLVDELAEKIREILRAPQPDYFDLVPLEESLVVEPG